MAFECIEKARNFNWDICIYGLGYLGKRLYKEIPSIFGLKACIYSDGNDEKVDTMCIPDMSPIHKKELLLKEQDTLVFVLVDDPYDIEIEKTLETNPKLHVLTLRNILLADEVAIYYWGAELFDRYMALDEYKE